MVSSAGLGRDYWRRRVCRGCQRHSKHGCDTVLEWIEASYDSVMPPERVKPVS